MTLNTKASSLHECRWCGHRMDPDNAGCSVSQVTVHGGTHVRIKWGEGTEVHLFAEAREGTDMPWPWPCPGCGAAVGEHHHPECEAEDCPAGCAVPLAYHTTPVSWVMGADEAAVGV